MGSSREQQGQVGRRGQLVEAAEGLEDVAGDLAHGLAGVRVLGDGGREGSHGVAGGSSVRGTTTVRSPPPVPVRRQCASMVP